jgi:hypothetical protein
MAPAQQLPALHLTPDWLAAALIPGWVVLSRSTPSFPLQASATSNSMLQRCTSTHTEGGALLGTSAARCSCQHSARTVQYATGAMLRRMAPGQHHCAGDRGSPKLTPSLYTPQWQRFRDCHLPCSQINSCHIRLHTFMLVILHLALKAARPPAGSACVPQVTCAAAAAPALPRSGRAPPHTPAGGDCQPHRQLVHVPAHPQHSTGHQRCAPSCCSCCAQPGGWLSSGAGGRHRWPWSC